MFFKHKLTLPDNRPAFTQMIGKIVQPNINGYTLSIDENNLCASIINLKKGGKKSMLKTVIKALEGFEQQFDELNEMKLSLEAEKEVAKEEALAEVEKRFAVKSERIDKVLETVSVSEEVECSEDEPAVEEVAEEEIKVENGITF